MMFFINFRNSEQLQKRFLVKKDLQKFLDQLKREEIQVVILNFTDTSWPVVDFLLPFVDENFVKKTYEDFKQAHNIIELNSLENQVIFRDRSRISRELVTNGIPTPISLESTIDSVIKCTNEFLFIDNKSIPKPFIEKPCNSESHDIKIYHQNGTSTTMQKIKGVNGVNLIRSNHCEPRKGSYIYEQFLEGSQEIKVYVGGDNYFHAETKDIFKGYTLDKNGLEIRQQVELTEAELEMCRKVQKLFNFFLFGFDFLQVGLSKR